MAVDALFVHCRSSVGTGVSLHSFKGGTSRRHTFRGKVSPMPGPFLSAHWRDLAMLNYAVPPALLAPYVPAGTELDTWHGTVYASVIGFRFLRTRVLGISVPGYRDFDEVNLRFYVRRHADDGMRRGVVFIRELVPHRAIAWTARAWYNEPYRALPMRHDIARDASGECTTAGYSWKHAGEWGGLTVETDGPFRTLQAGSEAEFITEHYWGYTRQRDGSTIEYSVRHPRWRVAHARHASLRAKVAALYGPQFVDVLSQPPTSAFLAEGSDVVVFRPTRVPGT